MSTRSQIRAKARETLGGSIFQTPWLITLLVLLVVDLVISAASSTFILYFILNGPVLIGVSGYLLKLIRKESEAKNIDPLLDGFKNDLVNNIILGILQIVFIFLWSLLFVIPGIVKSYSYAMANYIKSENPSMTGNDAITESRKMMNGHKLDLFLLDLSFIGWILLSILTLGIGILWVNPYMQASHAHFYEELKAQQAPIIQDENAEVNE